MITVPHEPPPLLAIRDLTVSFGSGASRVEAIRGVSLTMRAGRTLAVVGESGSGKSVTALSVLRLLPRRTARCEGRILLEGEDLLEMEPRRMRRVRGGRVAMIFQEPATALNPVFTIGEQIVEAIRLHQGVRGRRRAESIAAAMLAEVGIAEAPHRLRSYPHELSGGMRQRAMIAMALVCRPALLLADEPTTALDVVTQQQILDLLARLRREHRLAVMLISHDLRLVEGFADAVAVMWAGRVVEYAGARDLFDRPRHPYTRALLACIPRLGARRRRLVTVEQVMSASGAAAGADGPVPWTPHAVEPAGADDYVLAEIEPEHWTACRRGDAIAQAVQRPPDV